MDKKRLFIIGVMGVSSLLLIIVGVSYALFTNSIEGNGKLNIVVGEFKYKIESNFLSDNSIEIDKNSYIEFPVTVTSLNDRASKFQLYYTLSEEADIEVGYIEDDTSKELIQADESKIVNVVIRNNSNTKTTVTFNALGGLEKLDYDSVAAYGKELTKIIPEDFVLIYNYTGEGNKPASFPDKGEGYYAKSVSCQGADGEWDNGKWSMIFTNVTSTYIRCTVELTDVYKEDILNGADPVLADNLVPVTIADTGAVTKADKNGYWYSYKNKEWANAVRLSGVDTYNVGDSIPESAIESYFVWIPKYSYKIWDLGTYNGSTSIASKEQTIEVKFGLTNTSDNVSGECTTPGSAGLSGNCVVGDYMTHPAFTSFNANGIWVGKFETGYNGASSTSAAQVSSRDSSKIIIKPNAYSWRSNSIGNMFDASYNYLRNDESHMMKNTEWGAVAYLSHSVYGINTEISINNNNAFLTGCGGTTASASATSSCTNQYGTVKNYPQSTTGTISGVFDMNGGAWEYVMGYSTGASTVGGSSGLTSIHSDFFTNTKWNQYYDKYSITTNNESSYFNRILGDATGEMGPFTNRGSWYDDVVWFVSSAYPWFWRGGYNTDSTSAGSFAFENDTGSGSNIISFRIVLIP